MSKKAKNSDGQKEILQNKSSKYRLHKGTKSFKNNICSTRTKLVLNQINLFRPIEANESIININLRPMQLCILLFPSHSKAKLKPTFVGVSSCVAGAFFTFFFFG